MICCLKYIGSARSRQLSRVFSPAMKLGGLMVLQVGTTCLGAQGSVRRTYCRDVVAMTFDHSISYLSSRILF